MTTLALPTLLMYRVKADYGLMGRVLCDFLSLHDWSKWAFLVQDVKPAKGQIYQARECLRCGLQQTRKL